MLPETNKMRRRSLSQGVAQVEDPIVLYGTGAGRQTSASPGRRETSGETHETAKAASAGLGVHLNFNDPAAY